MLPAAITKPTLRTTLRVCRAALPPADRDAASARITARVQAFPGYRECQTLACYVSLPAEVATAALIQAALAAGKRVALPRCSPARRLTFHLIHSLDGLVPGPYGILEPPADSPQLAPAALELILIPGLGFDAAGNRLGYGAGYYDGFLPQSTGCRVGLAFACQCVAHIPADPHDVAMDWVVTEAGLLDCARGRQPTDHLRLANLTFFGHHGAFSAERDQGIRLAVDLDLRVDLQVAGLTDHLAETVDYPAVYALVAREQASSCALLETLAARVAAAILAEFPQVAEVTVRVRKFQPPVGGLLDAFEVELTRRRPT